MEIITAQTETQALWAAHTSYWLEAEQDDLFMSCTRSHRMSFEDFERAQAHVDDLLMRKAKGEWYLASEPETFRRQGITPSQTAKHRARRYLEAKLTQAEVRLASWADRL